MINGHVAAVPDPDPRRRGTGARGGRTDHPHQDDRPGLHVARLQPIHRPGDRVHSRSQHLHPGAGLHFFHSPAEVAVAYAERAAGESKYPLYKLIQLNFDLVTGFSLAPLQMFSLVEIALSLASTAFVVYLAICRLIVGPEAEGLFTLFGIDFLLMGILLFGIGLLGEYIGRIYQQVRERPRFTIQGILEQREEGELSP